MNWGAEQPPPTLLTLEGLVNRRLSSAGVPHWTRLVPPTSTSMWSLLVEFEDGYLDDLYCSPQLDTVAVVPEYQEVVSSMLAVEYVAWNADLISEAKWWQLVRAERAALDEERRRGERLRKLWRRAFR